MGGLNRSSAPLVLDFVNRPSWGEEPRLNYLRTPGAEDERIRCFWTTTPPPLPLQHPPKQRGTGFLYPNIFSITA